MSRVASPTTRPPLIPSASLNAMFDRVEVSQPFPKASPKASHPLPKASQPLPKAYQLFPKPPSSPSVSGSISADIHNDLELYNDPERTYNDPAWAAYYESAELYSNTLPALAIDDEMMLSTPTHMEQPADTADTEEMIEAAKRNFLTVHLVSLS